MTDIDLPLVSNVFSKFSRIDRGEALSNIECAVERLTAANCSKAPSDGRPQ